MAYVSTKKASAVLGVTPNTLRRWAADGRIVYIRTPSAKGQGNRLYDVDSYIRRESGGEDAGRTVCYCRVSSQKQKDDLQRQIAFMQQKYPHAEIIWDIASGLNFKRQSLNSLLERICKREIETVVVAHKDRLMRFGFDLFHSVCKLFGTTILVLDDVSKSPEHELVTDILSIIHIFGCRINGLRKYSSKIKKDPDISIGSTKEGAGELDGSEPLVL